MSMSTRDVLSVAAAHIPKKYKVVLAAIQLAEDGGDNQWTVISNLSEETLVHFFEEFLEDKHRECENMPNPHATYGS
jgi:hypothetical protein